MPSAPVVSAALPELGFPRVPDFSLMSENGLPREISINPDDPDGPVRQLGQGRSGEFWVFKYLQRSKPRSTAKKQRSNNKEGNPVTQPFHLLIHNLPQTLRPKRSSNDLVCPLWVSSCRRAYHTTVDSYRERSPRLQSSQVQFYPRWIVIAAIAS